MGTTSSVAMFTTLGMTRFTASTVASRRISGSAETAAAALTIKAAKIATSTYLLALALRSAFIAAINHDQTFLGARKFGEGGGGRPACRRAVAFPPAASAWTFQHADRSSLFSGGRIPALYGRGDARRNRPSAV